MRVRLTDETLRTIRTYTSLIIGEGTTGCCEIDCVGVECFECNMFVNDISGATLHISELVEKGMIEE